MAAERIKEFFNGKVIKEKTVIHTGDKKLLVKNILINNNISNNKNKFNIYVNSNKIYSKVNVDTNQTIKFENENLVLENDSDLTITTESNEEVFPEFEDNDRTLERLSNLAEDIGNIENIYTRTVNDIVHNIIIYNNNTNNNLSCIIMDKTFSNVLLQETEIATSVLENYDDIIIKEDSTGVVYLTFNISSGMDNFIHLVKVNLDNTITAMNLSHAFSVADKGILFDVALLDDKTLILTYMREWPEMHRLLLWDLENDVSLGENNIDDTEYCRNTVSIHVFENTYVLGFSYDFNNRSEILTTVYNKETHTHGTAEVKYKLLNSVSEDMITSYRNMIIDGKKFIFWYQKESNNNINSTQIMIYEVLNDGSIELYKASNLYNENSFKINQPNKNYGYVNHRSYVNGNNIDYYNDIIVLEGNDKTEIRIFEKVKYDLYNFLTFNHDNEYKYIDYISLKNVVRERKGETLNIKIDGVEVD